MELSQKALAMLLLSGLVSGTAICIAYALTDFSGVANSRYQRFFVQIKDYVFVVLAGLIAILTVYYVNGGEFRYLVLLGMTGGYALARVTIFKTIVLLKNAVLHTLTYPLIYLWSFTIGRLFLKVRMIHQIKTTEIRARKITDLASNGF